MDLKLKKLIEKQLALDFGVSESSLQQSTNLFTSFVPTADSRFWARDEGDIVLYRDKIYCRTKSELLTQTLKSLYENTSGQWFLEIGNVYALNDILKPFGLKVTNIAPFFVPLTALKHSVASNEKDLLENEGEYKWIKEEDIPYFKEDERITKAFCYDKKDPDKLGFAYYESGDLKVIAGANQNGRQSWSDNWG